MRAITFAGIGSFFDDDLPEAFEAVFGEGWDAVLADAEDPEATLFGICLLYTSDAADERSSVDLGGRRIIKKQKQDD